MADVTITPSENGPYLVSGPVHLTAPDGREIPHGDQMALCRCGGCLPDERADIAMIARGEVGRPSF